MHMPGCLLPEQPSDPPQHTILIWIIWVVLAGYLEHSREGVRVYVDSPSDPLRDLTHVFASAQPLLGTISSQSLPVGITYVLIYEQDGNILPLVRVLVESFFDCGCLRLGIDDEEVLLSIGGRSNMLNGY